MEKRYVNRLEAGRILADHLVPYRGNPQAILLALPRGGVPVAFAIARALKIPMDIFVVRKLGIPGQEEVAMGAIASGGIRILNKAIIQQLGISQESIALAAASEQNELERRENLYRVDRFLPDLKGRNVIVVDDGMATGSTMLAAIKGLKALGLKRLIAAVPVGAPEACMICESEVDEMICPLQPPDFQSVGRWYEDFSPTADDEVRDYLERAARMLPAIN
jgi:putative phosphoribosyl transferase